MTIKQCNSCKYHIYNKELDEGCFQLSNNFMKNKSCRFYEFGKINQAHKEFFKKVGEEYPFIELEMKND